MNTSRAPRASVVIPTFNSAKYLATTVESVLSQTMSDLELILHDDGSTDGTLKIGGQLAARDPRVHVIHGTHEGIAAARNRGFAATDSRSEFITFFDHDDVWEPNALEWLLDALSGRPELVAAHGLARCIDSEGQLFPGDDHAENMRSRVSVVGNRILPLPVESPTTFGAELVRNYITTPGTSVIRRSALEAVGGFEPSTVPCDDWDMNLRLCRRGDFGFVDRIVVNWRRHPAAASQSSKQWRAAYAITRQRTIDSLDNTPAQRQAARFALYDDVRTLQREASKEMRRGAFKVAARTLARSVYLGSILIGARIKPRDTADKKTVS